MFSRRYFLSRGTGRGALFVMLLLAAAVPAFALSSITGTVYDKGRNRIGDVDVELRDEYHRMFLRTRTDATGRYQFDGLRDGRWYVQVMAFRYDLEDMEQEIELYTQTMQGTQGTGTFILDFYLFPKRGGLREAELGVIFAQEVPGNAKKLYEKAVSDLANKKTNEGILGLNAAVQAFPDYFDALLRLGKELLVIKKFQEAAQCFYNAARVNPKSATSYYLFGSSLHYMGKEYDKAAVIQLKEANRLAPNVMTVLYLLGKIERESGDMSSAEKHLLAAKKAASSPVAEIHYELYQVFEAQQKFGLAADELEGFIKAAKLKEEDQVRTRKKVSELREKATASPAT